MREAIEQFIQEKQLSKNSRLAYTYDLEQFLEQVGTINDTSLRLYQSSLQSLKLSVQKRKLSAVNQFLYFLYNQKYIEHYYKLNIPKMCIRDREMYWGGKLMRYLWYNRVNYNESVAYYENSFYQS